jgi:hypothetical protein
VASCAGHSPPDLERTLPISRTVIVAVAVAVVLPVSLAAQQAAGASTPTSPKSLAKDLLTASAARQIGFTKVAEPVSTTSKTGEASCPNGAQVAFEDAAGQSGIAAEAVACTTAKAASALLAGVEGATSPSSTPPKKLGSSAIERSSAGYTYAIYWRRGAILELVSLTTNIPASSSTSTSTTTAAPPITPAEQTLLSSAAVAQNARLR